MVRSIRLKAQGIETLGDLARVALEKGYDEVVRLLAEACDGAAKEFAGR